MLYTEEHRSMMKTVRRFVAEEVDPYVDEWEAAEVFPAHTLFSQNGRTGIAWRR